MARAHNSRNAYWYEDPVTYLSALGGGVLSKGITQIIKGVAKAEVADCATDGQCAATKYVDDVIQFTQRSLRHAYDRYFADWGLPGHCTPASEQLFKQTIIDHINGPNTQQILGSYRKTIDAIHFFDPTTNLNAMTDFQGVFIGGWRLSGEQIGVLLATGNIP